MDDIRFLENKFEKEIRQHIRIALPNLYDTFIEFRPSSASEDSNLSFDLVFNFNFTISIRIRKFKYINFKDLTIRSRSKMGNKTEIDKIKEGKAQVYFYAYMNKEETELVKIRMADVEAIRSLLSEKKHTSERPNGDGTALIGFLFSDIKKKNGNIYKYDKID